MRKIFTQNMLIFILIVLVHVAFKMMYIDYSGFWYGETFNLFFSQQDWGLIKHTSEWDITPPLYYYFLWIWRNLFGESEFVIRLSSVIFSALAAGVLYLFTAKNFNRTAAIIAVFLFSAGNHIYYFSHEVNCYSILLFLTLSSAYFFFNLIHKRSWVSIILLGLCNFLLIYMYYSTIVILVIQFGIVLILFRKQIFQRIGIALLLTLTLSYLRFTKRSIALIFEHEKSFWVTNPSFNDFTNTIYEFFNPIGASGNNIFWIITSITILSLLYLLFSKKYIKFSNDDKIKTGYVFMAGWGTIILCFGISYFVPTTLSSHFIFAAPFFYILAGLIISSTGNEIKYVVVGLVCFFSMISFSRINFRTIKGMNYRDAAVTVKTLQTSETLTLIETRDLGHLFAYYFDRNIFLDFKNLESRLNKKEIYLVSSEEDLGSIDLNKYKRIVLTQSFEGLNPQDKQLMKFISAKFKFKVSTKHFAGVTITLFSK